MTSAPSTSITQLTDKKGKTIYIGERYKSFICSSDAAPTSLHPRGNYLFCLLPEGLCCSLGSQLLDTSAFGLVRLKGAMRGDIIFVSLPNGASFFHSCFGDSQWVAASIVEGARVDETRQR